MNSQFDFEYELDIAWCPGCGNFDILKSLKTALTESGTDRKNLVMVSGIGQAAKMPQYINANFFNGLHGRSLPAAVAVKATNPGLTVIAESGDGCTYGEGGNHFIAAMRRNPDITNIVHNNMVYGLTKGQASPTSRKGFKTPVQINGVMSEPFNAAAAAVIHNASFVARAFSGDTEKTANIISEAIKHRGYSLVEIFQPCVTFNKVNTFKWFKDNTYYLDEIHDPADTDSAIKIAMDTGKFALGIIYKNSGEPVFEDNLAPYRDSREPLYRRKINMDDIRELLTEV